MAANMAKKAAGKAKSMAKKAKSMASGMFSFSGLLKKACGMAGKFKFACLAVLSVVHFIAKVKKLKHKKTGVPCEGHPETQMNKECVRNLRVMTCSEVPVIFTQFGKFFKCREAEDLANVLGRIAKVTELFFCRGKKLVECWMKNHLNYDYCDVGIVPILALKANGFQQGNNKKSGKYMMKEHPYHNKVMPKNKHLKWVRMPMRPSAEVLKDWCKVLPISLLSSDAVAKGISQSDSPKQRESKCSQITIREGKTIPASWTSDMLIGA